MIFERIPAKPYPMNKKLLSSRNLFFIFLVLLLSTKITHSQITHISIANGNWNNPTTWSPAGVPTPADDSIIINTAVTFNQDIVDGQYMFRINAGASLIDLGNDSAVFGGDKLVVNGYFSVGFLGIGMNDSATIAGMVAVGGDFGQSGTFIIQSGGQLCVGQQFSTSDDFINNGSARTNNWVNGAAVTGNGGRFCIANYFINTDAISGNIDICDATPNTPYDVNAGTISGSVTYCALGPCGMCVNPNGISDFADGTPLKIYPNPFTDQTQIEINPALLHSDLDLAFVLYDVNGKEIKRELVYTSSLLINRENLSNGIYFYRLTLGENLISSGKLIAQ
jgi:hypothetical protein